MAAGRKWHALRAGVVVLFLIVCGAALLGGCSQEARYRVLSFFFEDVPKPGQKLFQWQPVVNQPRRPPPFRPTPTPTPEVVKAKPKLPRNWPEKLARKLPRDNAGYPDMVRALDQKLIKAKSGIKPHAKPQPVLNLDVKLVPAGPFRLVFPHKPHTQWLTCANCHPKIFKMKAGADKISMAALYAGKYCGTCHGKVAFPIPTGCPRCHVGMGQKKSAKPAPLKLVRGDVTLPRVGGDAATKGIPPAVFPHLPHRLLFRCYVCHDRLFHMKRGADSITMDKIVDGKFCGACHNGRVAFGVTFADCARCHRGK